MGWIVFCIIAWSVTFLIVPLKLWPRLWPAGIAGMLVVFPIERVFTDLNSYEFIHNGFIISGMPLPYWLSFFPGAVIYAYFRPFRGLKALAYIMLAALLLLIAEFVMLKAGYFRHDNWNFARSYLLNIYGFIVLQWLLGLFRVANRKESNMQ